MKKSMIITMLILFLLGSQETFAGSLLNSSAMLTAYESSGLISETLSGSQRTESAAIWPFKPKYNQNRIQRKNTPTKKNRRNKKLLRKWGLGMMEMEVPNG